VVVDCGPASGEPDGGSEAAVGDCAVLFGPGGGGEPTAQDWADELGTLHYEVVTGVHGRRVRRTVVDGTAAAGPADEPRTTEASLDGFRA